MNEEEKRLFDEDMEKYGITFEEWIVKMEEIAEEVEREQEELKWHLKHKEEMIAKFKKRHPNGAVIDVNATIEQEELNIKSQQESINKK